jgi:hypothetical protein
LPPLRLPVIDMICLDPRKLFNSGFVFSNCIFKNCSFQRITGFVSIETYLLWKDNTMANWIGVPPSEDLIKFRNQQIAQPGPNPPQIPESPKLIEDQSIGKEIDVSTQK